MERYSTSKRGGRGWHWGGDNHETETQASQWNSAKGLTWTYWKQMLTMTGEKTTIGWGWHAGACRERLWNGFHSLGESRHQESGNTQGSSTTVTLSSKTRGAAQPQTVTTRDAPFHNTSTNGPSANSLNPFLYHHKLYKPTTDSESYSMKKRLSLRHIFH